MAEIIRLEPPNRDEDGAGFLDMYLREWVYLNAEPLRYLLPRPYEWARIDIRMVDPAKVFPTAKYVLRKNLARIAVLADELAKEDVDIFNLRGVVKIRGGEYICPPILEVWGEAPYNGTPVIVDGAHRLYLARQRGIQISCVEISGNITSMLPVLPLKGWHEVLEQDTVPEDKRNYHPGIPGNWQPHELYRQRFHGSGGPRITSS